MVEKARKRQKTSRAAKDEGLTKAAKLSKLLDDESKDDEERRLESLLFGAKYEPKGKGKAKERFIHIDDEDTTEEDLENDAGGRELQHLVDDDLFFVDEGVPSVSHTSDADDAENSGSEDESGSDSSSGSGMDIKTSPTTRIKSKKRAPAWVDPSDAGGAARVSLLSGPKKLRKLRHAIDEDEVTGKEYETRLRAQFERINPQPSWAKKTKEAEAETNVVDDLLTTTNGIVRERTGARGKVLLPQTTLSIERVRDANHSVQDTSSGEVRVVSFHPKPSVPVLCVATADRRVRLFNVDGHLSPLLATLHVPNLPLASSTSALFHPEGNTLLLSGPRPFFYTYDLQHGTTTLHRRGLWGSESDHASILNTATNTSRRRKRASQTTGGGGKGGGGNTDVILHTAFSPGRGSILAVAGGGGNVQLVDWTSGAGQVIGSLKCNTSSGGVQGLWWVPSGVDSEVLGDSGAGSDGHLAVLTGEAEVYIWDVGQRRCVKRWRDDGGYRGAGRTFACSGGQDGWMSIGSTSGLVNVYGSDSYLARSDDSYSQATPKPLKSLGHLTTPISTLKFNHDSQLLAMASKDKKDAMRLVHLPSLTSFANWPTSSTPLGHVTALDFSTQSEYLAVGNTRGKVLMYHLRDYGVHAKSL